MRSIHDMSESDLVELLEEAIFDKVEATNETNEDLEQEDFEPCDLQIRTFEAAMILTDDKGLVVRIGNAEFQITVVRSN